MLAETVHRFMRESSLDQRRIMELNLIVVLKGEQHLLDLYTSMPRNADGGAKGIERKRQGGRGGRTT